jgi:hypothetical protein
MKRHSRKWWALAAVAGALLIAAPLIAFYAYFGGTYTYHMNTTEAQQRLDAMLKRNQKDPKVVFEDAKIRFERDLLVIDGTAHALALRRTFMADVHAEGRPDYRGGSFYFKPDSTPRFTNIKMEKVEGRGGFFKNFREKGREWIAKHGYEDLVEEFKADFNAWVKERGEAAIVSLLSSHPLYTLPNDAKGYFAQAVLEKFEVVGDQLHITISLKAFAWTIFLAISVAVLSVGIIIFLLRNPEFGIALVEVASVAAAAGSSVLPN